MRVQYIIITFVLLFSFFSFVSATDDNTSLLKTQIENLGYNVTYIERSTGQWEYANVWNYVLVSINEEGVPQQGNINLLLGSDIANKINSLIKTNFPDAEIWITKVHTNCGSRHITCIYSIPKLNYGGCSENFNLPIKYCGKNETNNSNSSATPDDVSNQSNIQSSSSSASVDGSSEEQNNSIPSKCGELIYFCAEHTPCDNYKVIDSFSQDCVQVVKEIAPSIESISNGTLAKKYGINGVPAFVFVQESGCVTHLGGGYSTSLKDIQDGIANAKCTSNSQPIETPTVNSNSSSIPQINSTPQDLCSGCYVNSSCLPIEFRKEGKYCSENKLMITQKQSEESCDNNFECESNVCASGKCVSADLITKILNWFRHLFGFG